MRGRPPKRKNERFKAPTHAYGDTELGHFTPPAPDAPFFIVTVIAAIAALPDTIFSASVEKYLFSGLQARALCICSHTEKRKSRAFQSGSGKSSARTAASPSSMRSARAAHSALARGHYPGERLKASEAPGVCSLGYWHAAGEQRHGLPPRHRYLLHQVPLPKA